MFYWVIVVCTTATLDARTCDMFTSVQGYATLEECLTEVNEGLQRKPEAITAMGSCVDMTSEQI
jgi:hypothetical protein